MMKQVNPEAYQITQALALLTVGSLNISSHRTNTNIKSHILSTGLLALSSLQGLKELW